MNVLVVDDSPNLARVTAVALRTLGCVTFTAHNTAEATRLLGAQTIEAIFLDVHLGAESGLDYLSSLRMQPAAPPVILFTAEAKDDVAEEASRRGAFGCLIKPYDLDDRRCLLDQLTRARSRAS